MIRGPNPDSCVFSWVRRGWLPDALAQDDGGLSNQPTLPGLLPERTSTARVD